MGTTTISLSDETKARFDAARPEQTRSAGQFLNQLLDNWEGGESNGESISDLADALATVEERTGRIERQLEDLQR